MERFIGDFAERPAVHAHRAPDLPVPVDDPVPEPHPNHPHHPDAPVEQEDPVPDRKPE